MTLVLPDAGRMATLQQLEGPTLRRILTTPILANVQVTLPRWTTRSSLPLKPALTALGMPTAFTDSADFSGMTTKATLKIGAVLHQGWIAVDEAGTEASAATAVEMRVTSGMAGEPVTVSFDRPFLYVVHDVVTGTPLFLGRLSDPTAT